MGDITESDGSAKVDKNQAGQKEGKNEFTEEFECCPGDNFSFWMGENQAYNCDGQEFHQGYYSTQHVLILSSHDIINGCEKPRHVLERTWISLA